LLLYPDSNAAKCIRHLAKTLLSLPASRPGEEETSFWSRCFHLLTGSRLEHRPQKQAISWAPEHPVEDSTKEGPSSRSEKKKEGETAHEAGDEKTKEGPYGGAGTVRIQSSHRDDLPANRDTEEALPMLVNRLIESVSAVSTELRELRVSLENGKADSLQGRGSVPVPGDEEDGDMVALDFESFLRQRGINPEEQVHESEE
jgi:hypothetical protein